MPLWLRKYTFSEIKKYYDNINKQSESKIPSEVDSKINKPKFQEKPNYKPTY